LAKRLKKAVPRISNVEMTQGTGDIFEVRAGESLVFSKVREGRFPGIEEVIGLVEGAEAA
jgi:predicted Rdx family selenoprotein